MNILGHLNIELWSLPALAAMALIAAEACSFVLQRPFLQSFEIRELIALGATDYLVEKSEVDPMQFGHVSILHQACQQLDFFDIPSVFGSIPRWSSFFQV